MSSYVGIDLGTTFSAIATITEAGIASIVVDDNGHNIIPSCVAFDEDEKKYIVGEDALGFWVIDPDLGASRFKREMGTDKKYLIAGEEKTPTELSALVLKKIKQYAEERIGVIHEAVVTIPANFASEAREATMAAAKAAGLKVKYIINEPTAAALYYAHSYSSSLSGTYAVYDLGGGTFDVSIIKVKDKDIEVISTCGVSRLGGDDFDQAIMDIVSKKYLSESGDFLNHDDYTILDAEKDKKALSRRSSVKAKVGRKLIEVTREEFEEAISSKIAQAEMLCESVMDEAEVSPLDIKGVFLAGGSTRIPAVTESVKRIFKQEPTSTVNVDEVVALGAALYAAYKSDGKHLSAAQKNTVAKISVSESSSQYYGTVVLQYVETRENHSFNNSILIEKGESIPCSITKSYYTVEDGQSAINCRITESMSNETDLKFVKVIWEGDLSLPENRPKNREVQVTYSYDENQIMKCTFLDVESGRKKEIDLSMAASKDVDTDKINKFIVE